MALALVFALAAGHAQTAKPVITKIDPPNWFTRLPDSLLLVHGEHLEGTAFTLRNTTAHITEANVSANGHWAFLTIVTRDAKPAQAELVATNVKGSTSVPYALLARRPVAEQPRGFNSADVMYLIMPDRFADGDPSNDHLPNFRAPNDRSAVRAYHGGDLKGIEQHLDYLQQLGVTTLWTTPLYDNTANQSASTYHGYSATDMYAVDPHFGTMQDYRSLVNAAHARGMKIVLDTVPNHVGPATPWASDPPAPGWLHGTPASHIKVDDDFQSVTDPSASPERRRVLLDGWFADVLPDLNQDNPLVAQYLTQNAIWWIEMAGLDGLRIDTFPYVPRSFWHDYNQQLHSLYPQLTDVGEVFNKDPAITSFFAGGVVHTGSDGAFDTGLDTPFDFPMYFALRDALTHRQPMTAVADVLKADSLYPHPERLVTFIGNHDTTRFLYEPGSGPAALHLGFGLLATLRGMPEIYYGDEIGMNGGGDPNNRKDFPGGWPSDKQNAFLLSERTPEQQKIFEWASTVLQLRLHTPALRSGSSETLEADRDSLAFVRALERGSSCADKMPILVVANDADSPRDVVVPADSHAFAGCTTYSSLLSNGVSIRKSSAGLEVHLPAQEIGIFRAQP